MSVVCSRTHARMEGPAATFLVATSVCASMDGVDRTVLKTLMTVQQLPAAPAPHALTELPLFSVSAPMERQVGQ